ncbi:MAG: AAA family ATPase [Proteobacteria bacterium]|nr:AAA family ATPase [Pseudomonadota bacterium]MBU1583172.1 AAA family ATPase [Pseudomonadota bacterium]MBU2453524.1 AAA family ATPase [Pseudomonadota bacterium]MBU2630569.1 AAA family ATPase [Pseudomonadota bacterium]
MKILSLRFKNLNSLYGEWCIDFSQPEYVVDGIFVITGPTGAGKSTILDAVCLALYGRTPRLKSIGLGGNEIMSRQTGECFAEVSFETRAGNFQCHWSQRKAYQKADGNLLDSKHEISDAVTGQVLASKKRDVAARIEQETGMDFDRFTRSILLAQGGFAAFLQAVPDDRAPILEQITGTRIYSEISKKVHDRRKDEEKRLELLEAKTAGIAILSDEDETSLNRELVNKRTIETEQNRKNEDVGTAILWLMGIETVKNELLKIDRESEALSKEIIAFKADKDKLQKALTAAELESEYATIVTKRQQQDLDFSALAKSQALVPDQEKKLASVETNLESAKEAVTTAKQELKNELALIKKIRPLDLEILQKQSILKIAESDCRKIMAQLAGKKEQHQKAGRNLAVSQDTALAVEAYLSANACDADLVTQLTGISEQIKNLTASMTTIDDLNKQVLEQKKLLAKETDRHKKQETLCRKLANGHDAAKKGVIQTKKAISNCLGDRLLREYRAEHDGLLREMAYKQKIASLEEDRAKLQDNTPCPLCGSLHHPFAQGNIPKMDETQRKVKDLYCLIQKAEQLENQLKTDESEEKRATAARAEAETLLLQALHKRQEVETILLRSEKELQTASNKYTGLKHMVGLTLEPFGIPKIADSDLGEIVSALKARQKNWQDHQTQKSEIEKKDSELKAEIKSLDEVLAGLKTDLKEKQEALDAHQKAFETLTSERNRQYGRKNPDTEEKKREDIVIAAENFEKTARKIRDDIKQQLNESAVRIAALKENTGKRKPELDDLESSFTASLKKAGFKDAPTFISCRVPLEERNTLSLRSRALDEKKTRTASQKKDWENRLYQEIHKKLTIVPLDDLKKEQIKIRESLKALGEEVGAIKQKLSDNTLAKAKLEQKTGLIDARKKECARWNALHALIGSADGKKFRNFAQGLTFELMVSHANRQLEKMSDRYLLVRDEKQPLELNIVDNYQAGEIRSTKNLSGGESFIVSLSLSLGLSNMASRNVRVDSLFLDEGFGTLDEDALETSLEALAGLQQKGKLIGVISHVSALKERIATQISIAPLSGGKSCITGPGCRANHNRSS